MDTATTIQAIINTLNTIPVSGAENLDRMLGCIRTLEKMRADMVNAAVCEVAEK